MGIRVLISLISRKIQCGMPGEGLPKEQLGLYAGPCTALERQERDAWLQTTLLPAGRRMLSDTRGFCTMATPRICYSRGTSPLLHQELGVQNRPTRKEAALSLCCR